MSHQEIARKHIEEQMTGCSDGKCRNIQGGLLLYTFNLVGMIPGGTSVLIEYFETLGYEVNRQPRCQPGKGVCIKRK